MNWNRDLGPGSLENISYTIKGKTVKFEGEWTIYCGSGNSHLASITGTVKPPSLSIDDIADAIWEEIDIYLSENYDGCDCGD